MNSGLILWLTSYETLNATRVGETSNFSKLNQDGDYNLWHICKKTKQIKPQIGLFFVFVNVKHIDHQNLIGQINFHTK